MTNSFIKVALCCGILGSFGGVSQVDAATYSFFDLGVPANTNSTRAEALNESGEVAVGGTSSSPAGNTGFRWSEAGGLDPLPLLPAGTPPQRPTDINEAGRIAGGTRDGFDRFRAVVWETDGSITSVGSTPVAGGASIARAINDNDQVIVEYLPDGFGVPGTASLIDPLVGEISIGDLAGGPVGTRINALSNSGVAVGASEDAAGTQAVRWSISDGLQALPGLAGGSEFSFAFDVNEAGRIVGVSDGINGSRAVMWDPVLGLVELGDLGAGSGLSQAFGVNDAQQAVGAISVNGEERAFLWDETDGLQDLNLLAALPAGWTLTAAIDIADNGTIAGRGTFFGQTRGFVLKVDVAPVPLPASILMLLGALSGLVMMRRRSV